MCLAQGPQRSDAGEAQTRGSSVSSQALYHWATALPASMVGTVVSTALYKATSVVSTGLYKAAHFTPLNHIYIIILKSVHLSVCLEPM